MKTSMTPGNSDMSTMLYYQPVKTSESYTWPPSQNPDNKALSCTTTYQYGNSPSTASFSTSGSPPSFSQSYASEAHHSPDMSTVSDGFLENDESDLRHKLRELEAAMLEPDNDVSELTGPYQSTPETEKWDEMTDMIARRDIKEVLFSCAKAVEENDFLKTEWLMSELRQMVSVTGNPTQRLGAYMLEGLVAKLAFSGSSIYKALRCKEPAGAELLSYMHLLYEVCPYFKFGYMSANGAIAEAMKDEKRIHIIDFLIAQGSQWITLIQALASRPGGPPHIRITGIDDSTSAYARGGGLEIVGQRLKRLAEAYKVPFEFHAVSATASEVEIQDLGVQKGVPLAVNFALMLHHVPDESVGGVHNHRDRLLRMVKSLNPKIVTLVEQESNTNTTAFVPRFLEAMKHYMAIFESIDATLPREHKERVNVEQHCLAREIVNIIACEGAERVERHELLGKWRSRFYMAGFSPYPLNTVVNAAIKALLENYSKYYSLSEKDGALYLGWMNQDLVAACAWK